MNPPKDKKIKTDSKFIIVSLIFFVLFIFVLGSVVLESPIRSFVKAREAVTSPAKSFMVIWPLTLPADGKSISKVSVFLRNDKEEALAGKTARLTSTVGTVKPAQVQTDNIGKADFQITSDTPGNAVLSVSDTETNTPLSQQISIEFTNP